MNSALGPSERDGSAYDVAVIGGGVMGCTVALHLARAGMRAIVLERDRIFRQASGVNAGTLAMQTKTPFMVPYHLKGWELWRDARSWLGQDVGFAQRGSINLAFTDAEAETLQQLVPDRVAAGAPIEFIGANRALKIEPNIAPNAKLYAYSAMDGYADALQAGRAYRAALTAAGCKVREQCPVGRIARDGALFEISAGGLPVRARRLVLAVGAWLEPFAAEMGVHLPLDYQVIQMAVTERMPPLLNVIVSSATNLLTLKQAANGSVLIGGGWFARGSTRTPDRELIVEHLIGNMRLAHATVAGLRGARLARTWIGINGMNPDRRPIIGPLPGVADAYVIGGVRSGFTGGPILGRILAQAILGEVPEMPIDFFDPARFSHPAEQSAG